MNETTYDVVIVGGGTAGSVAAARLAERTDLRVALVEAGPADEHLPQVLHVDRWMELLGGELDYDYTIEEQPRGNSHIRHSRARVLGGCSSHNSCIAFHAPDHDLKEWERLGAAGWGPDVMRPYFERVTEKVHIAEQNAGRNPVFDDLLAACEQVGLPTVSFNTTDWLRDFPSGAGKFQLNVRDGIRQSASVAYLHPLVDGPSNLDVLTETRVRRVLVEQGRAVGIETERGTIRAEREVVLAAGAFDTPKLLQLSGIGIADHLRFYEIDVVADLPVGEHLLDHPEGVVIFGSARPLPRTSVQGWELGIFASTDPAEDAPDLMFHLGLEPFDEHTRRAGYPTSDFGFSLTPNVTRARSEGWVRLASKDPDAPPRIDFRYFTDPDGHDERVMINGVRLAREIAAQSPLTRWVDREVAPGPGVTSDEEISHYVRTTANTVYHPAGTCRMGDPHDATTVVDAELRVLGIDGLRVADASVFPSMTSVNPAITVMAIGERLADLLTD